MGVVFCSRAVMIGLSMSIKKTASRSQIKLDLRKQHNNMASSDNSLQ